MLDLVKATAMQWEQLTISAIDSSIVLVMYDKVHLLPTREHWELQCSASCLFSRCSMSSGILPPSEELHQQMAGLTLAYVDHCISLFGPNEVFVAVDKVQCRNLCIGSSMAELHECVQTLVFVTGC